jgi:hypothetical protein
MAGVKDRVNAKNSRERTMPKITLAAAIPAALIAMTTVASAQWVARSQQQPDFSSCSASRDSCLIGTTRRGDDQAKCEKAFQTCLRTGTWDTYGRYGRRVEGIARR